jgi:drug/metabolite transporter (DMT)-like permease
LGLSKLLWIEGIHRISVTKASALSSMSPLLTLLFAWLLLGNVPSIFQLVSFIPMFFGVLLLSQN